VTVYMCSTLTGCITASDNLSLSDTQLMNLNPLVPELFYDLL